ncbi:MAG: hypothetical protein OXU77_09980 [Gammaproteobacteria bacterium]|nr:hypothetical protein [Gammaproteobacteria bacterium]
MGSVRPPDGAIRRRDTANPTVGDDVGGGTGPSSDARPDRPTDPVAGRLDLAAADTSLSGAAVAALLLTMAATPFLKGILAGFALAGAAAAVRGVLGA